MVFFVAIAVLLLAGGATAAARFSTPHLVEHRERAAGVHPEMQQLLDAWELEGSHIIVIAGGDDWHFPGGLRTDESQQATAASAGLSKASTLADTPHGRGAALDVWPAGFNPHLGFDDEGQLEGARELMVVFGEWAKSKGKEWGGDWPEPDMPHVQLPNWRELPYPPPDYRGAA